MKQNLKSDKPKINYKKLLSNLVLDIENNNYSYLYGTEGRVYFVDDNFIVKEFNNNISQTIFNEYCREISWFSNKGLAVPKIYAWMRKNVNYDGAFDYKYYILEERVKGNCLFWDLEETYELSSDLCDDTEFCEILSKPGKNLEVYSEILLNYFEYLKVQYQKVANISDGELEKFFNSLFALYKASMFSRPDIHSHNVMFDGQHLTIIDESITDNYIFDITPDRKLILNYILDDIFQLFDSLQMVKVHSTIVKPIESPRFKRTKDEVMKSGVGAIKKLIKKSKKMFNANWSDEIFFDCATNILDISDVELLEELYNSFCEKQEKQKE